MPTSAFEGRSFFTNHLTRRLNNIASVVDFGPGEGTYSILGRHIIPDADWIGVEVFEPYIEAYDLTLKYDLVICTDLRVDQMATPDGEELGFAPYDLAIFGDVLEHMSRADAIHVLRREAKRARYMYVSCPIIPAPQGESHGNPHEAHLYDWTFDEMSDALGALGAHHVDAWRGHVVGRWWVDLT